MVYSPTERIQYGGSSRVGPGWYGDSSDGVLNTTGNVTLLAANNDASSTIKQYKSITINSGHTLSAGFRTRALVLYCAGDAVINGSITMGNGAAAAASVINLTRYDVNGLTGSTCEPANVVIWTVPAAGAAGGVSDGYYNIVVNGTAGTSGQTGGGGAGQGGSGLGLGSGGNGAAGTAYSGGSGGGTGSYNAGATNGTSGAANGGAGGAAGAGDGTATYSCGGGAGNPGGVGSYTGLSGSTGTGGTLILIVGGNLTIGGSAVISANGSAGGGIASGGVYRIGGGGSGAGRVIVLYAGTLSNSGSIVATGGAGGIGSTSPGGAGGAGSVTSPTRIG